MINFESIQTDPPRDITAIGSTPTNPPRIRKDGFNSVPSSEKLRNPVGLTASSTEKQEDDEWSDENIEKWLERDKLDPALKPWVRATLGE
jgi:hypothetical protein